MSNSASSSTTPETSKFHWKPNDNGLPNHLHFANKIIHKQLKTMLHQFGVDIFQSMIDTPPFRHLHTHRGLNHSLYHLYIRTIPIFIIRQEDIKNAYTVKTIITQKIVQHENNVTISTSALG